LCFSFAHAQSDSADAVHIVPRDKPAPQNIPYAEQALIPHTRPLRADVNLVLVPVTVTDAMNHPVLGLDKGHFQLYEGDEQQNIRYFSTEDTPISIGILLDLSKSMSNKIDIAREALGEFLKTSNPEDDYFVVTFADRPQVLADATQSVGTIQAKLGQVTPSGHTALLDAIYLGLSKARHARYKRRALLIISDGGDNCSRYRSREIKSLVQESDVEIYAIGIFDGIFKTPEEWAGKRLLTEITEATGGHTVAVGNVRRLPEVAAAISLELRSQYVLGYQPRNAERDGRWRKIKVRLSPSAGKKQAQVYSKQGYVAPGK
jgi:Ca-activated chloride channel family protein